MRIYDRLLSLTLFQGLSHDDLSTIVESTRFDFRTFAKGETIVLAGTPCTHLFIVMSGTVEVSTLSDDHSYGLTESLSPPLLLEPERLFGLRQYYMRTVKTTTDCQVLVIEKQAVMQLSADYLIVRINLLNTMATGSQRSQQQPWRTSPETLAGRIVRFIEQHALRPAGPKLLAIKMEQLALELNASRLDISHALHDLQDRGLVSLRRGTIIVPALEEALRNW